MPTINTFDPMTAASEAIGAWAGQKRQNELQAKAEAYRTSRDQRTDSNADRAFGLQQGEAADRHAQTQQSISSQKQSDAITQEQHAYEQKMEPLKTAAAQIQLKLANGELVTAADRHKLAQAELSDNQFKAYLTRKYGEAAQQVDLQKGVADVASTQAGTTARQFETQRGELTLPGELQGQGLENQGRAITNQYDATRNLYAPQMFQSELGASNAKNMSAGDKTADQDYHAALQSYGRKNSDFQKAVAGGKITKSADGRGYVDKTGNPVAPPVEPMSPSDFQASLADEIDAIGNPAKRTDPSMPPELKTASPAEYTAALIKQTENNPQLSLAQKRQTVLAIKAAQRGMPGGGVAAIPGGTGGALDLRGGQSSGGSQGNSPFRAPLLKAAAQHGVPPQIALRLMGDESGGNAGAVSNAGAVGLLQLEPAAAAEVGVTDRRDPIQNINGGLAYLAKQFKAFGSWPLALAAYNAGPGNVAKYGMRALMLPGADPNYVTKILGGL